MGRKRKFNEISENVVNLQPQVDESQPQTNESQPQADEPQVASADLQIKEINNPLDYSATFQLGLYYENNKMFNEMKYFLDFEIEQFKNAHAAYIMGLYYFNLGNEQDDNAFKYEFYLNKSVEIYLEYNIYKTIAIDALIHLMNFSREYKKQAAKTLLNIDPENEHGICFLACHYKNFEKKNKYFDILIKKPVIKNIEIYFIIAEYYYYFLNDFLNSVVYIKKYLEYFTQDSDAVNAKNAVYAVKRYQANPDAYYLLGLYYDLYIRDGLEEETRLKLVEKWYMKAIKRNHPQAMHNYGLNMLEQHDYIMAFKYLNESYILKQDVDVLNFILDIKKLVLLVGKNNFPKHIEKLVLEQVKNGDFGEYCGICFVNFTELEKYICLSSCGHVLCWNCQIKLFLKYNGQKCCICE